MSETLPLLISKAKAVELLGEHEKAITLLRQASSLIEKRGDPLHWMLVHLSLSVNLCDLGRHAEAKHLLPEVHAVAQKLGNKLDLLRVAWQQGRVATGLGLVDEGIAILTRVRSRFVAQQNAFDAALVTLELAEVFASLGRTAKVKELARESAPIFEDQGVHLEARRALALFRHCVEEERLTGELLRRVIAYLYRARHDPQLRFEAVA